MKSLVFAVTLCLSLSCLTEAEEGYCVDATAPNVYGIDKDVSSLVKCCTYQFLALGFNGYQFTNVYPLVAEIFKMNGQNLTALEYLASYCDDASNAGQLFCQVPWTVNDSTCGPRIVYKVFSPQPDESMCEANEACQSVLPSDPTFNRLIVNQFVCLINFRSPSIIMEVYSNFACYLGQLLDLTDFTGLPMQEQLETVTSQLLTAGACNS